jgi:WD40 repeat protein
MESIAPIKLEAYVPFQTDESKWSILTPLPELSGDTKVVVEIESKAGQIARSEFTVDFGVRRYVNGGIKLLSQSSNEKYLAIINQQEEIIVLDDQLVSITEPLKGMQGVVTSEVSNDGTHLVLLFEGHARIFNLLTNQEIRIAEPIGIFRILNSTNKILAVTGSSTLTWYNLQTGSKERELSVPEETIRYLELSSSEEIAIVATDKRNIYKVALASSPEAQLVDSCGIGTINVIDIASDSKSFAYNCNEVVFHHRLENETKKLELFRFKSGGGVRSLEFGLQNRVVLAGSDLGDWYLVNVDTLTTYPSNRLEGLEKGHFFRSSVDYISVTADSTLALISTKDGESRLLSLQDKQILKSFDDKRQVVGVGFITAKNQAFIASAANSLSLYRAKDQWTGRTVGQKIKNLSISGSGHVAAATIFDDQTPSSTAAAIVIDGTTMEQVGRVSHDRNVNFVNLSNDGQWLLSGSDDKTARITDLKQGQELNFIAKFNPTLRSIRKVTFDQKNDKILAMFSKQIFVFQRENLETPLYTLTANDWFPSAGFAGGDRYVISGSADKTAKIHHAETGALLAEVKTQGWVWSVDLTADGRFFAVLSADNKLRIFQTVLDLAGEITGLEEYFALDLPTVGEYMSFSPDSRYLAVSLWSGESLLIALEPKRRFTLYCSKTGFASPPAFSSDSQYLAVGQNSEAFLYRVTDGKPVQHIAHDDRITSLAFEKTHIWSGSWDGTLKKTKLEASGKVSCR